MIPSGARVWIPLGHTIKRKGMQGLALLLQQGLQRIPHGGDLFVFRGRAESLIKIIWHEGIGMSLYAKRLEKGRFFWPSAKEATVSLTPFQLACLLEGIDWRNRIIRGIRRAQDKASQTVMARRADEAEHHAATVATRTG